MKTLNDFIDGHNAVVAITKSRDGSQFIAYAANALIIGEMSAALTGGNTEMNDLRYGILDTDWYPVGYGATVEEAIINLNICVSSFISDEGLAELHMRAYNTVNATLYIFSASNKGYVFNPQFSEKCFPWWLKSIVTITEKELDQL